MLADRKDWKKEENVLNVKHHVTSGVWVKGELIHMH